MAVDGLEFFTFMARHAQASAAPPSPRKTTASPRVSDPGLLVPLPRAGRASASERIAAIDAERGSRPRLNRLA